ncbi:MAG: methyltransferase domain-containing protein, partial [Veillonella sp.]|nr:methyltransferase domain-containing protein [Veillonella sp.]
MTNTIQELTVNEAWRDEQDAWNHRSEYFVEMHNREDRKAQVTEFLAFLKDENLLPAAGGRTLDIGCGVCDYALGLAREGYKATGIDLSDGMIRGAKQLAEAEGLDLSLYIAPWSDETRRELSWDKSFDLAYSIFCPIMFDVENIRAMHEASHDKCLWIA